MRIKMHFRTSTSYSIVGTALKTFFLYKITFVWFCIIITMITLYFHPEKKFLSFWPATYLIFWGKNISKEN